ncbi:MAG: SRPBCC domain-containing protein [Planctomycetes bacterium]|nr:SRPBCC domain-containing protein [Planctomycetota bacterium]
MGRLEALLAAQGLLDYDFRIERVFDAPRARVFDCWSRPESLSRWFAPKGLTVPACEVDFRVGGVWNLCMRMPDGSDHWMRGRYLEIQRPEKLVWECALSDLPPGNRIHSTVLFVEEGGKTRVRAHQVYTGFPTQVPSEPGWQSTLENLAAELAAS